LVRRRRRTAVDHRAPVVAGVRLFPRRLIAIVAIAAGVMFALLVPWLLARRGTTAGR
jgi:hypothetical protein